MGGAAEILIDYCSPSSRFDLWGPITTFWQIVRVKGKRGYVSETFKKYCDWTFFLEKLHWLSKEYKSRDLNFKPCPLAFVTQPTVKQNYFGSWRASAQLKIKRFLTWPFVPFSSVTYFLNSALWSLYCEKFFLAAIDLNSFAPALYT